MNISRINTTSKGSIKFEITYPSNLNGLIKQSEVRVVKGFSSEGNQVLAGFGLIISFFCLLLFLILFLISKINVSNKVKYELDLINEIYKSKNIKWSLHHYLAMNYIPQELYKKKLGKGTFMHGIKYDNNNNPYREEYIYFIEIESPSRFLQNLTVKTFSSNQNNGDPIISFNNNNNENKNNDNNDDAIDDKETCINMDVLKKT
ncbi:hypothetical protein ACTA71_007239 [Dictyostelium dimigraforme]